MRVDTDFTRFDFREVEDIVNDSTQIASGVNCLIQQTTVLLTHIGAADQLQSTIDTV